MTELNAGESFFDLALRMSAAHKAYFLDLYPPNEERLGEFAQEAQRVAAAQRRIEASDRGTFEEYLARYFATESKCTYGVRGLRSGHVNVT